MRWDSRLYLEIPPFPHQALLGCGVVCSFHNKMYDINVTYFGLKLSPGTLDID